MARIDDFRSQLIGGGARPSQFEVTLNFPGTLQGKIPNSGAASNAAKFMINATSLPASTISSIDVPFRGRIAKIAGERQFANWNVTILNDGDFVIRTALEAWSREILNHEQTNGILAPLDYQTSLFVDQLDRNDAVIKSYEMFNCWPTNISEISLDFANTNSIETYQVEFSVDYWQVA